MKIKIYVYITKEKFNNHRMWFTSHHDLSSSMSDKYIQKEFDLDVPEIE